MHKILIFSVLIFSITLAAKEWKDIPYYDSNAPVQGDAAYRKERCKLDLIVPDNRTKFPTLINFHGGGLRGGSKKKIAAYDTDMIAFVTVNYRLSGKRAQCPDYLYDAAAAVAWVIKNIEKYGGDAKQVYVSGQSAGGYLSAMIALDKRYLGAFGVSPKQIAGVFPITGQMSTHFQILNERRAKDPATRDFLIDEYAPIYHASKDTPPITCFAGDPALDMPARVEENQLFVMRMRRIYKNEKVLFYSIPGVDHSGCSAPCHAIINRMLSRLSKKISQIRK